MTTTMIKQRARWTQALISSEAGIIVVRSTRLVSGSVIPAEQSYIDEHFIDGDSLNPQKCRILLQLALTKTNDRKAIQEMFHKY